MGVVSREKERRDRKGSGKRIKTKYVLILHVGWHRQACSNMQEQRVLSVLNVRSIDTKRIDPRSWRRKATDQRRTRVYGRKKRGQKIHKQDRKKRRQTKLKHQVGDENAKRGNEQPGSDPGAAAAPTVAGASRRGR